MRFILGREIVLMTRAPNLLQACLETRKAISGMSTAHEKRRKEPSTVR